MSVRLLECLGEMDNIAKAGLVFLFDSALQEVESAVTFAKVLRAYLPAIRRSERIADVAVDIASIARTIDEISSGVRALITRTYAHMDELTADDAVYVKETIENTLGQLKDMIDGARPYLFGVDAVARK
jgi:hypothetical protein